MVSEVVDMNLDRGVNGVPDRGMEAIARAQETELGHASALRDPILILWRTFMVGTCAGKGQGSRWIVEATSKRWRC